MSKFFSYTSKIKTLHRFKLKLHRFVFDSWITKMMMTSSKMTSIILVYPCKHMEADVTTTWQHIHVIIDVIITE